MIDILTNDPALIRKRLTVAKAHLEQLIRLHKRGVPAARRELAAAIAAAEPISTLDKRCCDAYNARAKAEVARTADRLARINKAMPAGWSAQRSAWGLQAVGPKFNVGSGYSGPDTAARAAAKALLTP